MADLRRSVARAATLSALAWLELSRSDAGLAAERVSPASSNRATNAAAAVRAKLADGALAWQSSELGAVRGITIGPIESALHPDRGYGSASFAATLREAKRLGATWVSLTPFARVWDAHSTGISLDFEAPLAANRIALSKSIRAAHAAGLRVMLVPHLWVESGEWRGEIDPGTDASWQRWAQNYERFLLSWAELAQSCDVDMLALGIELRSWLTTAHAASFFPIVKNVRKVFPGLLTYAGNWDDVEDTVILGELDVIGINAFFPLADKDGADEQELMRGGRAVRERVQALAEKWHKPILFTEFGYTTRKDPAVRPWEWPDHMSHVVPDQRAQAAAYRALLSAFIDQPWFAGFFVWRLYADPNDMSQEAEWGFSPRGKLAELVLRDAFAAHLAADGPEVPGFALLHEAARDPGKF
jgi:hypothetical protein